MMGVNMSLNHLNSEHRKIVDGVLNLLSEAGLMTGKQAKANADAVVYHRDQCRICAVLETLSKLRLLSGEHAQANFDAVVKHENLMIVEWTLKALSEARLLSGEQAQANFDAVVQHKNPRSVTNALITLSEAGLLNEQAQANRDAIISHENPQDVAWALAELSKNGLLRGDQAQANRQVVIAHQDPWNIMIALVALSKANLLTGEQAQTNRKTLAEHQYPSAFARALDGLSEAGLLRDSQARFNAFNQYSTILFGSPQARAVWNFISVQHPLNQAHFDAIIDICNRNAGTPKQGRAAFVAYVNREILVIRPEEQQPLNTSQSTHTASVHTATDLSAWLLSKKYGVRQDIPDAFRELSASLAAFNQRQSEDPKLSLDEKEAIANKVEAAKACLTRVNG
ncbi:MAG: hypothetical protein Q8L68_05855, partial [Methylococcales bacterium]|nr:hypothetical protein [Methylococcales bacterium]